MTRCFTATVYFTQEDLLRQQNKVAGDVLLAMLFTLCLACLVVIVFPEFNPLRRGKQQADASRAGLTVGDDGTDAKGGGASI